jgi:Zn-dependent M28 family amino/carboxypeptidase
MNIILRKPSGFRLLISMFLLGTAVVLGVIAPPARADERIEVEVGHIRDHLEAFQKIANANGGSREAGTTGDQASRDYAVRVLKNAGFTVTSQPFSFPYFQKLGPSTLALVSTVPPGPKTYKEWDDENPATSSPSPSDDYRYTQYSAGTQKLTGGVIEGLLQAVDVTIPLITAVPNDITSGCDTADFAGFTAGNIALIQRGKCTFSDKVANAIAAGASGVILFNGGQAGRVDVFGTTVNVPVTIPVVFARFGVGEELYKLTQTGPVTVRLGVNGISEIRNTANIIGERAGQTDHVLMVGANLDSNFKTRGINDSGSGVATLLEVATQIKKHKLSTYNRIRIALWGASLSGRAGAYYYLDPDRTEHITPEAKGKIVAYLNLDTLGSKNGVPFVYNSDGVGNPDLDGKPTGPIFGDPGAPGSGNIEAVLYQSFEQMGVPAAPRPIENLSDYAAFIDDGTIPFGAMTSGFGKHGGQFADKTVAEANIYGGTAGQPYDPCALPACDNVSNISEDMLELMSGAAGDAIVNLANDPLPTR